MTRNKDILNELEQISVVVAQINPTVPYQVPEVYFETLSSVIMARIAAGGQEENSLLQVAGKQMPQDVPAGYFDTLSESILDKVKAQPEQSAREELASLSPLLAGISKQNVYEVPAGYFDGFEEAVNKQLKEETKVVSIFSRKLIIRYAAAAVVFTMIAFGINLLLKQQSSAIASDIAQVEHIKTQKQFNNELAGLSDDAIVSYLQMNADTKDVEKINESIDHSKLPEETDYMDDEFLESFMKELEKTTTTTNTQIN
ncbi:hypothetical protein WG954_07995 [Lacibacter sp. H375]|uniref:hypothetical protein n=1 Tax=Lacibacter sp. H375 TaxID=3133424 RepID=UPI0030C633DC